MKLAIARQRYNPHGGAERFVARALEALSAEDRIAVTLLARDWPEGTMSSHDWHFQRVNPFYLGRTWREVSFARAVRHRATEYDLLQSHERIPGAAIFRAGDGVHATWLEHDARTRSAMGRMALRWSPYHRYLCRAERAMFAHPVLRCVICNSRMVRDDIAQRFGVPDEKLTVIYNGVDTTAFHPDVTHHRAEMRAQWGIDGEAPLLAFVGSGFARKGVETALRAIAPLSPVHLVVAGEDKRRARYEALARELGMASRVRFLGAVGDVKPVYGAADAFILPTLYDPFPNACVEALACGLPLFTSTGCGAAEWVSEGQNGWVRDALDVSGYQTALRNWLVYRETEEGRRALRTAARATAEPYTLTAMAKALSVLYLQLVA
ncbi:MAG: glycosyltransferase family 4 protein [Proteobacteria bacterium]|nr:glycosyltransferase family 4 protein [Pseudomonadota bacterium]MCL2308258.1 glycosyltransferase family 4 protein [Pseudomonadota bacterium]